MRISTCTPSLLLQHLHGRALSPSARQFSPWEQGIEIRKKRYTFDWNLTTQREIFSCWNWLYNLLTECCQIWPKKVFRDWGLDQVHAQCLAAFLETGCERKDALGLSLQEGTISTGKENKMHLRVSLLWHLKWLEICALGTCNGKKSYMPNALRRRCKIPTYIEAMHGYNSFPRL